MKARDIVKSSPNPVLVICGTAIVIAIIGAYVFLANSGKDAAEISRFVNLAMNFVIVILGAGGFAAAAAANKNAAEAKTSAEETGAKLNGELATTVEDLVSKAVAEKLSNPDV